MPVDLTYIPERAHDRSPSSIRRWLLILMMLATVKGLVISWLWPVEVSTHILLLWIYFPDASI